MDRIQYVSLVDTNQPQSEVEKTLRGCGAIRKINFWKPNNDPKLSLFFVDFEDLDSVQRARVIQQPGTRVFPIVSSPQLIAHYCSLVRSDVKLEDEQSIIQPPTKRTRRHGKPDDWHVDVGVTPPVRKARPGAKVRERRNKRNAKRTELSQQMIPADSNPQWSSSGSCENDNATPLAIHHWNKENAPTGLSRLAIPLPPTPVSSPVGPFSTSTSEAAASTTSFMDRNHAPGVNSHQGSPEISLPSISASFFSPGAPSLPSGSASSIASIASPSIVLTFEGNQVPIALDSLDSDLSNTLRLLKLTAANCFERDKWMIVGSHYRSKGKVEEAAAVIETMIDVMTAPPIGLSIADLKPAYLMLASCHNDLAKNARRTGGWESKESKLHVQRASELFQHVFGKFVPPLLRPISPGTPTNVNSQLLNCVPSVSPQIDHDERVRELERDVAVLREQQADTTSLLEKTASAKRKVESDLEEERNIRRRIASELETTEDVTMRARRGERYALDQCKQEVDRRRKFEDRAAELRMEVETARRVAEGAKMEADAMLREAERMKSDVAKRDMNNRSTMGHLALMFAKAANGAELPSEQLAALVPSESIVSN